MPCWWFVDLVLFPLSCMSSPQVQSCDSLMKRSWWKLWDNIIFGGAPYGALRLVRDPAGETWPGLMARSCAAGSACQLITVCCVRNLAFLSIFTWHYPLSANEYNCLLAIGALSFPVRCNLWEGKVQKGFRARTNSCEHKAEKYTEHHHMSHYKESCGVRKTVNQRRKNITANMLLLKKDAFSRPISVILLKLESYLPSFIKSEQWYLRFHNFLNFKVRYRKKAMIC